jgi:predicted metal-dependent TIM-barrel fold hydrolase
MREVPLILLEVPSNLSDEAVVSVREFLYDFASAFENHFSQQIRRHAKKLELEIMIDQPSSSGGNLS